MHYDLIDLRLFVNVDAAGTITGGAEATHMTLASASERIRELEQSLGLPLLVRGRRGVQPTPAGRSLLRHARLVLLQLDSLQGDLAAYGAGHKGHVRLLSNGSAISEHLPSILGDFLGQYPGISIDLEERPSDAIADALRADACDVGVASDAADLGGLHTEPFRADPLALVVAREHPLARQSATTLAEVAHLSFVGLAEGSALQAHLAQHVRRLGKRLDYRIRLASFESVCRMVGQGIGIGIVPRVVATRCARSGRIKVVSLADGWAARTLVVCVRDRELLSLSARQLVAHLLAAADLPVAAT
jgi:DNA-binding transcriptional LysR family regulator